MNYRTLVQSINRLLYTCLRFLLLHLAYITAIGIPALLARLTGKRFLDVEAASWQRFTKGHSTESMY